MIKALLDCLESALGELFLLHNLVDVLKFFIRIILIQRIITTKGYSQSAASDM